MQEHFLTRPLSFDVVVMNYPMWVFVCDSDQRVLSDPSLRRIGLLLLDQPLDRETTDRYRLIVTASDGNPGGVRPNSLYQTVSQTHQGL